MAGTNLSDYLEKWWPRFGSIFRGRNLNKENDSSGTQMSADNTLIKFENLDRRSIDLYKEYLEFLKDYLIFLQGIQGEHYVAQITELTDKLKTSSTALKTAVDNQ